MTIDERLDRLVDRHEALAGSVELLVGSVRELTAAQAVTDERFRELATAQAATDERMRELTTAQAATDQRLTKAIEFSVKEARRERERRREAIAGADKRHETAMAQLDRKLEQLAAAQILTEQLLQRFLARGGNGHA